MNTKKTLATCVLSISAFFGLVSVAGASPLLTTEVPALVNIKHASAQDAFDMPHMNFQDSGSTPEYLNGTIFWTALPNETYFDTYVVGFANENDEYVATIQGGIQPNGQTHEMYIGDTHVPHGAVRIGVFISSNGVLNTTPVYSTGFLNSGGPIPISFEDVNPLSGVLSGDLKWTPLWDESNINSYAVGFADDHDNLLSFIHTDIAVTGGSYVSTLQDIVVPAGATRLGIFMVVNGVLNPTPPFSTGFYDYVN